MLALWRGAGNQPKSESLQLRHRAEIRGTKDDAGAVFSFDFGLLFRGEAVITPQEDDETVKRRAESMPLLQCFEACPKICHHLLPMP